MDSVNWIWGLSLIALTIAIHATGVVMMAILGFGIRARLETRTLGFRPMILIAIGAVGAIGLLLAVLHGIEAAIWAAAYVWLGDLNIPKDAILYSLDSMSTRGASGLMLEQHWQMMGALEAALLPVICGRRPLLHSPLPLAAPSWPSGPFAGSSGASRRVCR